MESQTRMWKDSVPVIIGQLTAAAMIAGIFAANRKLEITVIVGSFCGATLATANYLSMYAFACKAAEKAKNQDVASGKKLIRLSYMGRMVGLLVVLVVLAKSGWCNPIALAVPLALNRPILIIHELIRRKGGENNEPAR